MFDEKLSKIELLRKAKHMAREAIETDAENQRLFQEDFSFRDGDQWPRAEKEQLEMDRRPVLTFNVTKASVDLVKGLNEDIKVRYRANPVKPENGFACEVINKLIYWAYEANEWTEAEDEAFESAAIAGRGWVGIDFGPDPKQYGQIKIDQQSIAVHEVFPDPASRNTDLSDASYIVWDKWLTLEDFKIKYPKAKVDINQVFDLGYVPFEVGVRPEPLADPDPMMDSDLSDYDIELDDSYYDRNKRMIRLIHMEYWKTCDIEWIQDPDAREWYKLESMFKNKKEWRQWLVQKYPNANWENHYTVIKDKRVYWLQFVAHEILYDGLAPVPYDGFSVVPCFAYKDISKKTNQHFGVVRLMKDAQREINKRWSQTLNLINNQVQPGLYAEIDAFCDRDQAVDSIKSPGDVTFLEPGAIAKKKIMERSIPQFPNATFQLEEYAQIMLRRITGINPDLLGQDRGRQEPGVVVKLRQQQGLVILRPLFNSYKKMKRELFKRQVAIILKWMPIRQMKRILGGQYQFDLREDGTWIVHEDGMAFRLEDIRDLDYIVDLEETSASMTQRMFELAAMTEMQQAGIPADPIVMIQKMDLPETDKQHWIQYVQQQQQQASAATEAEIQLKVQEMQLRHQREMTKIILDAQNASDKTVAQIAKDTANIKATLEEIGVEQQDVILDFLAKMAKIKADQEQASQDNKTALEVADKQAAKAKSNAGGSSNES